MANYTSQLSKRRTPSKPINTEAIGFVLQSKEQAWDANQARIDESLSQLGSIDLIREEDKTHLLNNVENLLSNISNVGSLDLSSDSVARGLQNAIYKSIDDHTINQIINTKKIRGFNSGVQKLIEDDPEKYNDANYSYALESAGYSSYISGESDELGSLNYTPYVDVNAKVQKGIKDLRDYNEETEIEIPINDGGIRRIMTKKVRDLNETELRGYVLSQLGSQERQQLAIDGWRDFNGYDDQEVSDLFSSVFNSKLKSIDSQISIIKEQINNAPEYQKEDLQNRIAILKNERQYMESSLPSSGAPRNVLERVFKEQQLIDEVTSANLDVKTTYSFGGVDEAYYEAEKLKLEMFKAEQKKAGGPNPDQIGTIAATAIHEDQLSTEDIIRQRQEGLESNLDNVYSRFIEPEINGSNYASKKAWEQYKADNESSGKPEREMFQDFISETGNDFTYEDDQGNVRLFSNDINEAADLYAQTNVILEDTVRENFDNNLDTVYREVTSEGTFNYNNFPMIDKSGKVTPMKDEVSKYTPEEFKANKDGIKDRVRENLYKNRAFTELIPYHKLLSNRDYGAILTAKRVIQNTNKWLRLADGSSVEDYFNFTDRDGKPISVEEIMKNDPQLLGRVYPKNKQGKEWLDNRGRGSLFNDTNVRDEGALNKIVSTDTNDFRDKLEDNFYARSQQALVIRPNLGKGGKELNDLFQTVSAAISASSSTTGIAMTPIKDTPIIIQEDPTAPEYVVVMQPYTSTVKGVKSTNRQVGRVLKADLESRLGFELNTSKGEQIVNNIPVESPSIGYLDPASTTGRGKMEAFSSMIQEGNMLPLAFATKEDIINAAIDIPQSYNEDGETRTDAYKVAYAVTEAPANIKVKYVPQSKGGFVTIYNTKTGEEIHSIRVTNPQDIKKYRNTVRYAPQNFLGVSLNQMIQEYDSGNTSMFNKYLKAIGN